MPNFRFHLTRPSSFTIALIVILVGLFLIAVYPYIPANPFTPPPPVGPPPANYVQGSIVVIVKANTSDEAYAVMEKYTTVLSYHEVYYHDTPDTYFFIFNTPVGQEKAWIEKFQTVPSVAQARYALLSDY